MRESRDNSHWEPIISKKTIYLFVSILGICFFFLLIGIVLSFPITAIVIH